MTKDFFVVTFWAGMLLARGLIRAEMSNETLKHAVRTQHKDRKTRHRVKPNIPSNSVYDKLSHASFFFLPNFLPWHD